MADGDGKSRRLTFWGALQLMLIGLKLGGLIDWEWKLVLLPLEIDLAILGLCLLVLGLCTLYDHYRGY